MMRRSNIIEHVRKRRTTYTHFQSFVQQLLHSTCFIFCIETVRGIAEFSKSAFKKLCPVLSLPVEVAIHTILYVRQIYPADLFVRRKKYETPVWQSRHPALNEYISGAIKAVADELVHVRDRHLMFQAHSIPGQCRKGRRRDQRQKSSCSRKIHLCVRQHD